MPFLLPLLPAIGAGAASAGAGALVNGIIGSGGQKGSGFQAQGVPISQGNAATQQAAGQAQTGIAQQQALLQALAGQNGIGNQSSVFNQLQGVANGTGPNPAQAMLANATGANTANQAALMAGQRGAGANAGLIARQAAMQGAANQQNAAGQGAALQAQQSLGALGQLGGLASQQVGQQQGALNQFNSAAQSEQQQLLNQLQSQNQLNVQQQGGQNTANAGVAAHNAQAQNQGLGGIASGLGSAIGSIFGGSGGNESGNTGTAADKLSGNTADSLQTPALGSSAGIGGQPMAPALFGQQKPMAGPNLGVKFAHGGHIDPSHEPKSNAARHLKQVPAMVSPGEIYLSPSEAKKVADNKANPLKAGEKIKGQAKVKGDSLENDTVSKTLTEGGVVIPRSVLESVDPSANAAAFVRAHMAKRGNGLRK